MGSCAHQANVESLVDHSRTPASFQSCLVTMKNIMGYETFNGSKNNNFSKAKTLRDLEALYGNESLIDIQRRLSEQEIKMNNENIKSLFLADYDLKDIPNKASFVTKDEAMSIYRGMSDSKVHRNHDCYDPAGKIGFCFGRATIAHMEAIIRGVHPDAIRKIWIAGDMGKWGHHVATMIKAEKGWLVLDTNLGRVVETEEWIKTYMPMRVSGAKDIMIFSTQAGRFGPYDNQPYNAINLFNTNSEDFNKAKDYYRGYFHDYFESLDNAAEDPAFKEAIKAK